MSEQDYLKAIAVLADKVSRYHERLLAMERDFERHMKDAANHCPDDCDCKKSFRLTSFPDCGSGGIPVA